MIRVSLNGYSKSEERKNQFEGEEVEIKFDSAVSSSSSQFLFGDSLFVFQQQYQSNHYK